jgi:deoxyribonuclease-1/deoxyribonuclease-1-like protein
MKKIMYLILLVLIFSGCEIDITLEKPQVEPEVVTERIADEQVEFNGESFTIANWNLQVFGKSKAAKPEIMDFYEQTLEEKNYDIIIIQEIRDKSGDAFKQFCSMFEEYNCEISSRAGQTTSKEQYGILSKKGIEVNLRDYNRDEYMTQFNRPPVALDFVVSNYSFTAVTIHTDPDVVPEEMEHLENIVMNYEASKGNVVVLGDLNADCAYYNNDIETHFDSWNWLIKDSEDTTLSKNDCSYDRIILNDDMRDEYINHGIFRDGINKTHSDHYLVWGEFRVN